MIQARDSILFVISEVPGAKALSDTTNAGLESLAKAQVHEPTWYFIYLFTLLGIYAWINIYYGNVITQIYQSSTNFKATVRMFKNTGQLQNQLDLVLYVFYFLSMGFLLFYLEQRTEILPYNLQGGLLLLFNFALLASLLFGRVVIHNIAGLLFNRLKIVREYLYNMFIFSKLMGLVVLPLTFLLVYTKGILQQVVLWTSIVIILGILVLRIIRGMVFSYNKEVLIFYMFLYLCALEIAPLVLLYRWLKGVL
jgi:hypothetical protein